MSPAPKKGKAAKQADAAACAPASRLERAALLKECYSLIAALDGADAESKAAQAKGARLRALCDRYRAVVPRVTVARCPYSAVVVTHSVDLFGLDGLWWRYHAPIRPVETGLGEHYVVLAGAVRMPERPPVLPHLVAAGPEAPYVLPRLLKKKGVTAVLRGLRVGESEAWTITYFSKGPLTGGLANEWACQRSPRSTANVVFEEDDDLGDVEYEFDLAPFLKTGRLLWIAADDDALKLQKGAAGCPYVGLPGRQKRMYLQAGKVW